MQFNNINHYQPTFQSCTPIIATSKGKVALERALVNKKNQYRLLDLTNYFRQNSGADSQKSFLFLLTGKEYIDASLMRNGWEDILAPLRKASRAIVNITENSKGSITSLVKRVSVEKDLKIVQDFNRKINNSGPKLENFSKNCAF